MRSHDVIDDTSSSSMWKTCEGVGCRPSVQRIVDYHIMYMSETQEGPSISSRGGLIVGGDAGEARVLCVRLEKQDRIRLEV